MEDFGQPQKQTHYLKWIFRIIITLVILYFIVQFLLNSMANRMLTSMASDTLNKDGNRGQLSVSVLPSPSLQADDIAIMDPETKLPKLTIKHMNVKIALLPLYNYKLIIEEIILDSADLIVVRKTNGGMNWKIDNSNKKDEWDKNDEQKKLPQTSQETKQDKISNNIFVKLIKLSNIHITYVDQKNSKTTQFQLDTLTIDNDNNKVTVVGPNGMINNASFSFNSTFNEKNDPDNYPFIIHATVGEIAGDFSGTVSGKQLKMNLAINSVAGKVEGDIDINDQSIIKLNLRSDQLNIDKLISETRNTIKPTHDRRFWDMKESVAAEGFEPPTEDWPYYFTQALISAANIETTFHANQIIYNGGTTQDVNIRANLLKGDLKINPCAPAWLNSLGDIWFPQASLHSLENVGAAKPAWCVTN
jgi:hypothetical protein